MDQPHLPNSFVAIFDIIGFKELRAKQGTAGLMQKFERGVLPLIQHSAAGRSKTEEREGQQVSVPDFNEFSVQYRVFSDTVIFWTKDDSFSSFLSIIQTSSQLTASGFGGKAPYRGAVGYGDLLVQGEIMVGAGIEDAYIWEQKQAWAGVSLTPKCEEFCTSRDYVAQRGKVHVDAAEVEQDPQRKKNFLREARRLVRYFVPLQSNPKDGPATYAKRESIALDWTSSVYKDAAEQSMSLSSSTHATTIRNETIAFEKWARSRQD